jgi:uncharacterized protein YegP (UPF0339 family)
VTGRVELFKASGIQPWRFRLVGANGEIISQSEGYATRWNCKRTARKIAAGLRVELVDATAKAYRRFP